MRAGNTRCALRYSEHAHSGPAVAASSHACFLYPRYEEPALQAWGRYGSLSVRLKYGAVRCREGGLRKWHGDLNGNRHAHIGINVCFGPARPKNQALPVALRVERSERMRAYTFYTFYTFSADAACVWLKMSGGELAEAKSPGVLLKSVSSAR